MLKEKQMRKQYRYHDSFDKYYFYIYHDGELVETKKVWYDEFCDEIDKLESDGYTYGYTKEAVEDAKRQYEHMLENMIEVKHG